MRFIILIALNVFSSACTTLAIVSPATVVAKDGPKIALGYYTGTEEESLYSANFEEGARKACNDKGYKVIEKSFKPKMLEKHEGLLNYSQYYWVIECAK